MALSIVMPALEMAQETGKVVSWRKKEGETVTKGEPLLEVETDKAVVEIEAMGDGILSAITAREGDSVPVGQTIAWLLAPGEAPPVQVAPTQTGRRTDAGPAAKAAAAPVAATAESAAPGSIRISPKARRLAKERGVDLAKIVGSGPGGEILAEDILGAGGTAASAVPAAGPTEALSAIGRLMAERTTQSWSSVPHFFVSRDVDGTALVAIREKLAPGIEQARGVKPTHTDLIVALVGRMLRKHSRVNSTWAGDGIRANAEVNVGLAMAVNDGVVAAVIRKADTATLADIAVQRRELTERARANKLQPADLAGATFTISNLGMYHVDAFTAIIVQPQAGILAVGAMSDRVVAVDGQAVVRPVMTLTLSSDHRVVDGARAASFLHDLVEAARNPEQWIA